MTQVQFITLFLCTLIFGSIIGAYFGTADYRIRHEQALFTSHCYCPHCNHVLAGIHQIPIISWILLKQKCYYCHTPISIRYPLIEASFLLYYGITFLLLWSHLSLLLGIWFTFLCILILLRCQGHFLWAMKGIGIFAGFHIFYGFLLFIVYIALGIL